MVSLGPLIAGIALVIVVLWETFETIILPRRVTRRFRLTRLFYRNTWRPWSLVAGLIHTRKRQESFLSFYGPLSLLALFVLWAAALVLGFAFIHLGLGSELQGAGLKSGFVTDLYMSGTTLFTLGLGDVVPIYMRSRVVTVLEAGVGFGFLALVIGYLPVLYQSFSRREVNISLLDARAGSPPTAAELLRRHATEHGAEQLQRLLGEWERWAADWMESAISYPVLAYFRSQHDNQSWLAALTTILDTCALTIVGIEGSCVRQAQLTFAIARHATVDLAQVFSARPRNAQDRLPAKELDRLRDFLAEHGFALQRDEAANAKLRELRSLYEPYVEALSSHLRLPLQQWIAHETVIDNWKTSAWGRIAGFTVAAETRTDDHI